MNSLKRLLTLQIDGRGEDGSGMPVNFLGPGGHYGARGRMGPVVCVSVGVCCVMSRQRSAAGRSGRGTGGRVTGITGGPCRGVAISLAHLRARAQITVTALHLAGSQSAAGRFETGGRRGRGLVQIRVVHDAAGPTTLVVSE